MDDTLAMNVGERLAKAADNLQDARNLVLVGIGGKQISELDAIDKLHGIPWHAVFDSVIHNLNHTVVLQVSERKDLAAQATDGAGLNITHCFERADQSGF